MKKFMYQMLAILLLSSSITAEETDSIRTTMFIISSTIGNSADYVGQGKAYEYHEERCQFVFYPRENRQSIMFMLESFLKNGHRGGDHWNLHFTQKEGEIIPGNYERVQRFGSNYSLSFSGCGCGCNESLGNINILELEFDEIGSPKSFAANVLQYCGSLGKPPLFAALRYHSSVPIKASVAEICGTNPTPKSFFYTRCYHPILPERSLGNGNETSIGIRTSSQSDFTYYLWEDGDTKMLTILIGSDVDNLLTLIFSTSNVDGFINGLHEKLDDSENYTSIRLGALLKNNKEGFNFREYKIRDIEIDQYGNVRKLALDYILNFDGGYLFEGSIRYKSPIPVNLERPFSE